MFLVIISSEAMEIPTGAVKTLVLRSVQRRVHAYRFCLCGFKSKDLVSCGQNKPYVVRPSAFRRAPPVLVQDSFSLSVAEGRTDFFNTSNVKRLLQ